MLSALRNFLLTFLIAALIFGGLAYLIVGFVLSTLTDVTVPSTEPDDTIRLTLPEDTDPPTTDVPPPPDEEPIVGETFNILLVGSDYQPDIFDDYHYEENYTGTGFPDKRSRKYGADMLILVRVDKTARKFIFCPIPRTTRVLVDGLNTQIGDVYAAKNMEFLCGKVAGLTGLEINYWATLDVGGIADVVNALGGVTYYVPENMEYEDEEQGLVINLKKGTTNLNGEKAAQLLRYAGYGTNSRMNTAVDFLKAMLAKLTNISNLSKAPDFYRAATRTVKTNFTSDDFMNNLDLIFAYSKFEAVTITYPGSTKMTEGVTYFEPALTNAMSLFSQYK